VGRELTRAEFLKLSASLAGGATLAGAPAARALASGLWSGSDSLAFADTVLRGGKVAVMDEANTFAQAVAVVGGLILATGSDLDVQASIGPQTRVVELHGRTVTPGLVDPHLHFQVVPQFGGFYIAFIPPEVTSIAELQDAVGEELATLPAGTWLGGYYLALSEGRPPTRQDLDPASPDHPVFVFHQAGHYGTANTRALELAGITGSTADPVGGIIERDGAGQPTGVLYNHRAMDLVRKVMPRYTDQMVRDGILATQPMFAACGVTTYHDNNIRGASAVAAYQQLAREGRLTLRNALYFTLEYPSDVDIALNVVEHYQDAYTRFAGFKFLIDGQATTFYCHEPHTGVSWQTTTWEVGSFKQAVRALHDTGLQVCVHCGGDAAVDLALDAFEEAMNANPRSDPRHRLEHAVLTRAASTQRIKDLGVIVSELEACHRAYPDHHAFTPADLSSLESLRTTKGADWLACSEKDFCKIKSFLPGAIPLLVARNEIRLPHDAIKQIIHHAAEKGFI